jgi:recombinational DNA repair ATPase RecF
MKILSLHAERFRSMYEADWSPGDLNVLVGPNASGKTNLLRLLELLSHSAMGRLGRYMLEPAVSGA